MLTGQSPSSKRQLFAKEYVTDRNATQAAIRSGYSRRTAYSQGSRLLKNVEVQAEISALDRAHREVEAVDRGFVIAGLRDLALNAKTESNRVRAYELLGKTLKMFTDVTLTTDGSNGEIPEEIKKFSLPELLALRAVMVGDRDSPPVGDSEEPEPVETTARMIESGDGAAS
jgi:hypothetical protein